MLQLPGAWSGFLEEGKGDASCLGPLAGLEKQRAQYKAAVDALADPARTRLVLVARAQTSTLRRPRAPTPNWPPSAFQSSTWSSTACSRPPKPRPTRWPRRSSREQAPWPPCRRCADPAAHRP
jgi:hypothetical protein